MGINFPASPTTGDKHPAVAVPGEPQFMWDGTAWNGADATSYLYRNGDTMTGLLTLSGNPTNNLHAVPKQYAAPIDVISYSGMQYNGSMEVNQELGGAARTTLGHIVDSYELSFTGTMVISAQQVADAPPGLIYSCKMTATTGQASLGASDYWTIIHRFEGIRIARLAWGTANAQPLSLGVWVKASRTGVFTGSIRTATTIRSYPISFNISAANTWEWKTFLIPADTTALVTDMVPSLHVLMTPAVGATRAGTPNAWSSNNPTYLGATGGPAGIATNETFQMTGLLAIPGVNLPAVDRAAQIMRPYDQEFQLCRRYYQYDTFGAGAMWLHPIDLTSIYRRRGHLFVPRMRIAPTSVTVTGVANGTFAAGMPQTSVINAYSCDLQGDLTGAGYSYITSIAANARM
jgi:hypothetical protein